MNHRQQQQYSSRQHHGQKHPVEDSDSWDLFASKQRGQGRTSEPKDRHLTTAGEEPLLPLHHHRSLKNDQHQQHNHRTHRSQREQALHKAEKVEREQEQRFQTSFRKRQKSEAHDRAEELRVHELTLQELWANPGIDRNSVHGLMIDAGSTGSRMHVFEWEPRVLRSSQEIQAAVAGNKLSFPGTDSRWTDRLQPGISYFASIQDPDELERALATYLQPLLDFAKTVLHAKQLQFGQYPIFLRATAGMRTLETHDRARVMTSIRNLFRNDTYCPFAFADEQARVLSGEEESIYDWAGVNFLLGDLLEQSEGAGTVVNPRKTHGALDLGGASTQISFYEPSEDVMANLFKLQIGQAKHWNVYAHSFLYYGMNEALDRVQARLAAGKSSQERLVDGIHDPCLPGNAKPRLIRTDIHLDPNDTTSETWNYTGTYPSGDGTYQAMLKNDKKGGDFDACMNLTEQLLHLEKNAWCDFAHKGDCSFAGIYQPRLPRQDSEAFGEFVAFSNYYHVWKFLQLPERATLQQLHDATQRVCAMSREELFAYNHQLHKPVSDGSGSGAGGTEDATNNNDLDTYCFRSVYAFQLLHNGYGFQLDDTIRATNVINGHKVGWALGAMLYEINAMPWTYQQQQPLLPDSSDVTTGTGGRPPHAGPHHREFLFLGGVGVVALALLLLVLGLGQRRYRNKMQYEYEPIKEVEV